MVNTLHEEFKRTRAFEEKVLQKAREVYGIKTCYSSADLRVIRELLKSESVVESPKVEAEAPIEVTQPKKRGRRKKE